ncbi:MAG: hypothetical protein ACD_15C00204G0009 [uncultured bacterium]|nr:MAG: hypothetical protein ACD_15C00204G0009 [uncultured bacterium]
MTDYSKKEKYMFSPKKGFTLIELLVVISIMSIMASVGFMSYQYSKRDAALRAAQREVATVIRLAQSYATQGKTQGSVGSEFTPCGYGFEFTANNRYRIFYVRAASGGSCKDDTYSSGSTKYEVSEFSLEDYVTTTSSMNSTVMYFRIPFGVIQGNNGISFSGTTITLSHPTDADDTISVQVGSNGKVAEAN